MKNRVLKLYLFYIRPFFELAYVYKMKRKLINHFKERENWCLFASSTKKDEKFFCVAMNRKKNVRIDTHCDIIECSRIDHLYTFAVVVNEFQMT